MCEGEYESLKAIHEVSPTFVPKPYAWGKYSQKTPETYFLLAEFRDVGEQVRAFDRLMSRARLIATCRAGNGDLTVPERATPRVVPGQPCAGDYPSSGVGHASETSGSLPARGDLASRACEARCPSCRTAPKIRLPYRKIWLPHQHMPCKNCASHRFLGRFVVRFVLQAPRTCHAACEINPQMARV